MFIYVCILSDCTCAIRVASGGFDFESTERDVGCAKIAIVGPFSRAEVIVCADKDQCVLSIE